MMDLTTAERIRELGTAINPKNAKFSNAIYAPRHKLDEHPGVKVTRDVVYGAHPRNRLDVFEPLVSAGESRGVMVFVHGGNFVAGDKHVPGSPFYSNIGVWAVQHHFVGITLNYRLAPESTHPSGIEDLDQAIRWIRESAADLNIDCENIVLVGASAGATHVAQWVAERASQEPPVSGVVLLSGVYDFRGLEGDSVLSTYYGAGTLLAEMSPHADLAGLETPLMIVVSELDPPEQHRQFLNLAHLQLLSQERLPHMVFLPRHNHFSEVLHVGTEDSSLGCALETFLLSLGKDPK
ncbi:alpha/beta hydrolase [Citricoccus sp. K5]|uniref:alpha/beta hydrolase n=1 Tax=Citricoccus sp. K5 TaxID=2653135 RepID=UPI0012F46D34|nr:alpha/beta hydrolase [Citricoccus sp. K5]VXB90183.1 conserved hypothetical protein [Citricoccus sp. K5]